MRIPGKSLRRVFVCVWRAIDKCQYLDMKAWRMEDDCKRYRFVNVLSYSKYYSSSLIS